MLTISTSIILIYIFNRLRIDFGTSFCVSLLVHLFHPHNQARSWWLIALAHIDRHCMYGVNWLEMIEALRLIWLDNWMGRIIHTGCQATSIHIIPQDLLDIPVLKPVP
jgi:hypothetical protein